MRVDYNIGLLSKMRDDLLGLELDDTNEGWVWEEDMCIKSGCYWTCRCFELDDPREEHVWSFKVNSFCLEYSSLFDTLEREEGM